VPGLRVAGRQLHVQHAQGRRGRAGARGGETADSRRRDAAARPVSVVYDLPRNAAFLKELAQDLKRACGTGGTVLDDRIELQATCASRIRERLIQKGFGVKAEAGNPPRGRLWRSARDLPVEQRGRV